MLRDICETLGDEVVGGDLDRVWKAFVDRDSQPNGHWGTRSELLESNRETMAADDRGVNPARNLAQLSKRRGDLLSGLCEALAGAAVSRQLLLEQAKVERERDQPLLSAVMQVALESLPFVLPRLEDTRTRSA